MRMNCGLDATTRSSALWGKRSTGSRSSALWGKSGRGAAAVAAVVALVVPVSGLAASGPSSTSGSSRTGSYIPKKAGAFVPKDLREAAKTKPDALFNVIVQGQQGESTAKVAADLAEARAQHPGKAKGLQRKFRSVNGVAAEVSGRQLLRLAGRSDVRAITRDSRMRLSGVYSNSQQWPQAAGANSLWNGGGSLQTPTIAIVDSGIQANRADFYGRVLAQVNMTSLVPNSSGDGRGHGTFVASLAAGAATDRAGAAPTAPLVAIDVMDDSGMAMTSDVIASADWILANKGKYNIKVANFSLHSTQPGSFMFDPLNKAVEKLWFSGVVVVAAAGNYAQNGAASGVPYAPASDPFVITVGASEMNDTPNPSDDVAAPWSAFGYTADGFAKPELGAPGRYLIGAVPATSTMALERPDRKVGLNYMWMSGTSFSAPIVSGIAAGLLARHPGWGPDEVKGALMVSARVTSAANSSLGVGEVNGTGANFVTSPPNPNLALNKFVTADPNGGSVPVFDAASWASVAQSDASWASASWASASWASASWASASWASASWAAASWASASWAAQATSDASWGAASWGSASWGSASWSTASWAAASWVG